MKDRIEEMNACANFGHDESNVTIRRFENDHLIDVRKVAEILSCSERTVWRLRTKGRMPQGINLGRVVRWSYRSIMTWIAEGCPDVATMERSA